MKFQVTIRCEDRNYSPIDLPGQSVGLDFLDLCRKQTDVPNLDPALLHDYCNRFGSEVTIDLSEDQAVTSGHFRDKCLVIVHAPPKCLNAFASIQPKISKSSTTGEITRVIPVWAIDYDAILKAWIDAGYPLEWTPTE